MISYLLVRILQNADDEVFFEISIGQAIFMAVAESLMFMLYMDFGIKILNQSQIVIVFAGMIFAVYACVTGFVDWRTGYVYDIINIIAFVIILIVSIVFSDISSRFIFYFIFYIGILLACEKMQAFCRGDTEFLAVMYLFFGNKEIPDLAINFMLFTLLAGAVGFGVFRRVTGRKEGLVPYTPFIVLSEIINIIIFSCCCG